jgi:hypothetical protein
VEFGMEFKMDRSDVGFVDNKAIEEEDDAHWACATVEEKLEMITYLRECFYGIEATTGRLQRFFEFVARE